MKKDKYFEKIRKKTGKALYKYQLVSKNDKILIALSGGKDSIVLLEVLTKCRIHIPFHFDIYACHIIANGVGYHVNKDYLEEICYQNDVKLYLKYINVFPNKNKEKYPCFVCSWNRRQKLFETCRELGCNKLAFGHHMDDAVETLFLNMFFHGSISSLPQKINLFNGDIQIIRPLLHLKENEIIEYANLKKYSKEIKTCYFDNKTYRNKIKQFISELEGLNSQVKLNIFRSMDNIYSDYLPKQITANSPLK